MSALRFTADSRACRKRRRGFTLTELAVVVVLIGVTAAFAIPSYRRAIEQSRVDIAGANLRAIWAAERVYWLENQTYTSDLGQLQGLGLLDKKLPTGEPADSTQYWDTYFWYSVLPSADASTLTANANASTYTNRTCTLQIDNAGKLSGNVTYVDESVNPPVTRTLQPLDFW